MEDQDTTDLVLKTETFVSDYMSHHDASHDYAHVRRVVGHAQHIARTESPRNPPYDLRAVTLAALLHDVGDAKYTRAGEEHGDDGAHHQAREFLLSIRTPRVLADKVQEVVNAVSYSAEVRDPARVVDVLARHPELGPVQDGDRLDAIGAVGIGRCFTYCGAKGGGSGLDGAIAHLDEKLIRLGSMMKTETGRKMARERSDRLALFREWYVAENPDGVS